MRTYYIGKKLVLMIILLNIFAGCSTPLGFNIKSSTWMPGANSININKLHVEKHMFDKANINIIITEQLKEMGYLATTESEDINLDSIDAIVLYKDRWMWDFNTFMYQLTIYIKDPDTGFILGVGKSNHYTLDKKSPEFMVREILASIFKENNQLH